MEYQSGLKNMIPDHEFFIGIDSDGCVFDTMEIKQKEFFIPNALKYFDLFTISDILIETWEFVNLYSKYRGGNRFNSLLKVFELLQERDELNEKSFPLPDMTALKEWTKGETKLGNASLRNYFNSNYDPDLEKVIKWTEAINKDISENLRSIPPFPNAKKTITKMSTLADILIVSQTPLEALEREWKEHDLKRYVRAIAGQEQGTKTEHIALAAKDKYNSKKILMIGDALGDLEAARNNGILFFPIIPGEEDETWGEFMNVALVRFINGTYKGKYEESLLKIFDKSLPDAPPWKNKIGYNKNISYI